MKTTFSLSLSLSLSQVGRHVRLRSSTAGAPVISVCLCLGAATARETVRTAPTRSSALQVGLCIPQLNPRSTAREREREREREGWREKESGREKEREEERRRVGERERERRREKES